ncbi:hypothetical protein Btru_070488 [Bulinus truncatus]|nr:hypothetical protein Btru_070488 [Bulinus truncatus]
MFAEATKHRKTFQEIKKDWGFSFGFELKTFKKYPELIPLVGIMSFACIGAASYILYMAATKPDARFNRSLGPPHEEVSPTECRKLICMNPEAYRPIAELEAIKHDLKLKEPKKNC